MTRVEEYETDLEIMHNRLKLRTYLRELRVNRSILLDPALKGLKEEIIGKPKVNTGGFVKVAPETLPAAAESEISTQMSNLSVETP
jgi:hypothetical protein